MAFFGLLLSFTSSKARAELFSGDFGPYGLLHISKPEVYWNVWSTGTDRVVSAEVSLNGLPIPARYDPQLKMVLAQTQTPLSAGEYRAYARIAFNRGFGVSKEWIFTVREGAVAELPETDRTQLEVLDLANRFRSSLGLPLLRPDRRLMAAANGHSKYHAANGSTGHFEVEGKPGFLGVGPTERVEAYGYSGGCYESLSFGEGSIQASFQCLIDAPYHRLPLMQPGELGFGSGFAKERLTLVFELAAQRGTVVYPFDGQTDVPLAWSRSERPSPLRIHAGAEVIVGFPITLAHFAQDQKLKVDSAELKTASGEAVPYFLNTPQNDPWLKNSAILIPKKPLRANTQYVVTFAGSSEGGEPVARTWKFTTRSSGLQRPSKATSPGAQSSGGKRRP